jgi:ABC-type nitrate/sulfonate/bicarbonate transport system substrate-binding protein
LLLNLSSKRACSLAVAAITFATALSIACGGSKGDADTITVQLDWTPNTNHIGIYIAQEEGWYEDAGLSVAILPYTDVNPDVVVANGRADVGVSFPPNVVFSRAAGLDIVSVAAVLQRSVTELAVLDSSEIKRPRDFEGKTYAGFGLPYEEPQIKAVISADGGRPTFPTASLSTAAYEAIYNRRADFTEIYTTWEGIEAELRGIKLRTFRYDAYGVPDFPGVVLVSRQAVIDRKADALQRFLNATQRGYELAAKFPEEEASRIFLEALPKGTFPDPELIHRSTALLSRSFLAADGHWGPQDKGVWESYARWLLDQGIVTDGQNRTVRELSGGPLFTDRFLIRQDVLPK